ncbi:YggW family oxidoreductase [Rhodanobacter thiooxydans]|uniref:Heme chaperone HemW n=1 Tax=Rhodanobacter thiooxydans TaxID=416169 RepID=A0A154QDZ4_9GAMM|nr:radical SAM family heme chaperone HemW [Rhodanobacter thiooxydans]EIM01031.1 HemN family oxidoreductase [Rhodanobacter thiooxydans LCS2]KZC22350.1 YggW family oxidoreductase [Rhodanobacter thiooxydans]MCW0203384.1 radical SAM family heme chaperone HemW [Rhodanobacter thiooxydans]
MSLTAPPLSLYVHMPWCVKKCPYCDFNSHGLRSEPPPYAAYIDQLLADLDADRADLAAALEGRPVISIFFGGGTPSLFAPELIARLLDGVRERLPLAHDVEITLETNPGTVEHGRFDGYLAAGVNRISFGVQSFDDDKLRRLGRIHSAGEAEAAVKSAQDAGYANINLDLMYALPRQDLDGALTDVERAVALGPTHISHYQLTLEPNTVFAANPPPLPDDDHAWAMQEACEARLAEAGYGQYEISAYAQPGRRCLHNLNYWEFGDYLGIGAGAHGKLSDAASGLVRRRWKSRHPRAYMEANGGPARIGGDSMVGADELPFEYMLNALRLVHGVPMAAFAERTGLPSARIAAALSTARQHGWLHDDPQRLHTTVLGQRFLNDVIGLFLD